MNYTIIANEFDIMVGGIQKSQIKLFCFTICDCGRFEYGNRKFIVLHTVIIAICNLKKNFSCQNHYIIESYYSISHTYKTNKHVRLYSV